MESLHWLIELARRAGVLRIVVNGSFVTDKMEPNDVDCVLLIGPGFPTDEAAGTELVDGCRSSTRHLLTMMGFAFLPNGRSRRIEIAFRKA